MVHAAFETADKKPLAQPVTGQVSFARPTGAPASVPAQYDAKTGVLSAAGPSLEADITPVHYTLDVGGTPWTGSNDVPKGGTPDLVATAKLQPPARPDAVGPNGGVVQTVGPDRVELVANKHTGDVRAYVLDTDNHAIDPGDRKVTVALQGEQPEVVVLAPEPQAHFLVGHVRARVDPAYLTVAVNARGTTHACLVGWAPGSVVVANRGPRVHLLAVDAWPGEAVEVQGWRGRHHGEVVVGGPGVVVGAPGIVGGGGAPAVVVGAGAEVRGSVVGVRRGPFDQDPDHDHDRDHKRRH